MPQGAFSRWVCKLLFGLLTLKKPQEHSPAFCIALNDFFIFSFYPNMLYSLHENSKYWISILIVTFNDKTLEEEDTMSKNHYVKLTLIALFCLLSIGGFAEGQNTKYITESGITIPENSKGIPDCIEGVNTMPGRTVNILLVSNKSQALLDISGSLCISKDGKIAKGTKSFKPNKIMYDIDKDKWINVVTVAFTKDGFLQIIDEKSNSWKVVFLSSTEGKMEKIKK